MYGSSGLLESIGWFPDGASLNEADLTKPDREASGYVERVLNRPKTFKLVVDVFLDSIRV